MHASCESPWHSLAKHCILDTCFLLTAPFRGMLLTPQGGPRCLAPTAHQIPVYLMVFSTFLCRAFTAQYLYTPRYCYISPLCFTAQRRLEVHNRIIGPLETNTIGYYPARMSSLITKWKKGRPYLYWVRSARVKGQPRMVEPIYLGPQERV